MRSRTTLSTVSLVGLSAFVLVLSTVTAKARKPPIASTTASPVVSVDSRIVDELPTSTTDLRLLLQGKRPIDGIVVDTGRKYVSGSQPHVVPSGWTCTPRRGAWRCNGPAIAAGERSYFSWQSNPDIRLRGSYDLSVYSGGDRFFRSTITPRVQHGFTVKKDLKGALDLPSAVAPGSLFMASPMGRLYQDGTWGLRADGKMLPAIDPATLRPAWAHGAKAPANRLFFRLPPAIGSMAKLDYSFTYDDPWGDRIVEAPAPAWFYSQPGVTTCAPAGLTQCQDMVSVGGTVCVCGCFPDPLAADLTLDGRPIGFPTAFSLSVIRVPLGDTGPGAHVIAWPEQGQSVKFEAVAISGALAQEKLKLGQSTRMMLQLNGSRRQMPLEVKLNSGGVKIQGGNKQIAFFNGGNPNRIHRTVLAVAPGDFSIGYTFDPPSCPCGGWEGPHLLDSALATHPMSLAGYLEVPLFGEAEPTHLDLSSDSLVVRSPRPPFDPEGKIEFSIAQLGLSAMSSKYGDLRFEQRSDAPSKASVSNLTLGHGGGLAAGDARFDLHTEFSIPNRADLPLKVGGSYDFKVNDFGLEGVSSELGKFSFKKASGDPSSIHLRDLRSDASGKTLYGNADLELRGRLRVNF